MQSLCTLRNHCRQGPRNTRYQADATQPGPDFHRLDRTSLRLAHSFDDLVGASEERWWDRQFEQLGGPEINNEVELGRLLNWQIGRLRAVQYFVGHAAGAASPAMNARLFSGRDASCLAPPAQIRTCGFPACGSHLEVSDGNRLPYAVQRL